jgi:hypothetical protein
MATMVLADPFVSIVACIFRPSGGFVSLGMAPTCLLR